MIHNHDRKSPITRVPRTETRMFFSSHLCYRFRRSPKVVKEAIMTDIDNLVQEFLRTSSKRAVGASFLELEMRRLHEILEECLKVGLY